MHWIVIIHFTMNSHGGDVLQNKPRYLYSSQYVCEMQAKLERLKWKEALFKPDYIRCEKMELK